MPSELATRKEAMTKEGAIERLEEVRKNYYWDERPANDLLDSVISWLEASPTTEVEADKRLKRIAEIIEAVDQRCMAADGPVTPTLKEMTQEEISEIYKLATESKAATEDIALTERGRNSTKAPAPEQSRGADDLKALREKVDEIRGAVERESYWCEDCQKEESKGALEGHYGHYGHEVVPITVIAGWRQAELAEIDALAAKRNKVEEEEK